MRSRLQKQGQVADNGNHLWGMGGFKEVYQELFWKNMFFHHNKNITESFVCVCAKNVLLVGVGSGA